MFRKIIAMVGIVTLSIFIVQPVTPLYAELDGPGVDFPPILPGWLPPGLASSQNNVTVVLELEDLPAVVAAQNASLAQSAILDQSSRIQLAQNSVRAQLAGIGVQELFSTQLVYNGIVVLVPAMQLPQLRQLAGVRDLHVLVPKELLSTTSIPFGQAPGVWLGAGGGATGAGVKIGVIDTGIDYTHADFGGTAASSFPTAKVVGGRDFVGDSYDPQLSPALVPDDDPRDCNGHGTLVAGIAAGFGVTADGATYAGSYGTSLDLNDFRIAPGVAPQAQIYALKVTGCGRSTTKIFQAIEWAMDPNEDGDLSDRMDVINISLGSPFGSPDDPDAVAASAASAAGVVVVAGAGNSGDSFYSISSPASSPAAIAVAATNDTRVGNPDRPDSLLTSSARGPQQHGSTTKPDLAAPGSAIISAAAGTVNGAAAIGDTSAAAAQVSGAAALLRQLHPDWTPLQVKAALINTASPIQASNGAAYAPTLGGSGRLNATKAASTDIIAYTLETTGGVGLDFGSVWLTGRRGESRWRRYINLKIENHGASARRLAINSTPAVSEPSVSIRPSRTSVTVPAHGSIMFRVRADVFADKLDFSPDLTVPFTNKDGFSRYYVAEQAGSISIAEDSRPRIRIVNGSSEPAIDVYLDDELIASGLAGGQVSDYVSRPADSFKLRYYRSGTAENKVVLAESDHDSDDILLGSRELSVGAGTDATMLLRDTSSKRSPVKALTLIETAFQNAVGIARVRFINNNAVPSLSTADVYLDGQLVVANLAATLPSAQVASGQPVLPPSGFFALLPGMHEVAFFASGTSPATGAALAKKSFVAQAGEVLTLVSTALAAGQQIITVPSQPRELIRVPYSIAPKRASDAVVDEDELRVPPAATLATVTVQNAGVRNNPLLSSERPLMAAFELAYSNTQAVTESNWLNAARLRYTGIASDYQLARATLPGGKVANSQIFFAIAAQDDWATPNQVEFQIFIDTNLDATADYVLVNTSLGSQVRNEPDDVFVSVLYKITNGVFVPVDRDPVNVFSAPRYNTNLDLSLLNRRILFMRTYGVKLGLSNSNSHFRYQIVTRHRQANGFAEVVDQTPALNSPDTLFYDVAQPLVDATNADPAFDKTPVYNAVNGALITMRLDSARIAATPGAGLLLFYFHNIAEKQTQVIPVISSVVAPAAVLPDTACVADNESATEPVPSEGC